MISRSSAKNLLRNSDNLFILRNVSRCSNFQRSKFLLTSQCDDSDGGKRRSHNNVRLTGLFGLTGLAALTGHKILAEEEKKEEIDIFKKAGTRIGGLPDYRCRHSKFPFKIMLF